MTDRSGLPTRDRLLELLASMQDRPVMVVADLVADHYITGRARRISREAPVLILDQEGERLVPGGGANAVANIRSLGGQPHTLGRVGADGAGDKLLSALAERGIDTAGIDTVDGYATPTKTRILGGGPGAMRQQIVRIDAGSSQAGAPSSTALSTAPEAAVVVLSDYGYGYVEPALIEQLRKLRGTGVTVIVDSRYRLNEFRGLDGATPNQEEAEQLAGVALDDDDTLLAHGPGLLGAIGARFLLVTRGSRGMVLFTTDGVLMVPVWGTDQVADVTGAGDTVIGTFALALAAGARPPEAAILANYAGGIVVMKAGTATVDRAELERALRRDPNGIEGPRWAKT